MIAKKLPDVREAKEAVLVLWLHGRGELGSSAIGLEDLLGQHAIFPAHSLLYRSTEAAFEEGRRRLRGEGPA